MRGALLINILCIGMLAISTACHKGNSMGDIDYANDFSDEKEKALISAIMIGDGSTVKRLASEGVNLCAVGQFENTPMAVALKLRQMKIVKQLLELGVNPNFRTPKGVAAAKTAVTTLKDPGFLKILLDFDLNPNLKSGTTPLILFAVTEGNWHHYEMLLSHGADINSKDGDGSSLLLILVLRFKYDRAKALMLQGADFTTSNANGLNVLDNLVDAQRRFCEDPNSRDCRSRAELLKIMRTKGTKIPPGLPGMDR
jgi:ankyrin repeat protein